MIHSHGETTAPASESGFQDSWTDIFRSDTLMHLCILVSIAAGCFQGYLKDRFAGPVPYALADAAFMAAAFLWFAGLVVYRRSIDDPGHVAAAVLGLVAVPFLYLLLPGTPLPIQLAGLRAWSVMPLACLMGLSTVRTAGHVRAYVGWIALLCVVTAIYGIRQYQVGPDVTLGISNLATERHGRTVFYEVLGSGQAEFRAFSTFTFPAPFAGMMVFGMLLAAAAGVSRNVRMRWRLVCLLLLPLFFVGLAVSGTRSGLVMLLAGLVIIARFRRLNWRTILLTAPLLVAAQMGLQLTSGRAFDRFATVVTREGLLWGYVFTPVVIAWRALAAAPFGLGLGRSGVGVPYRWVASMPRGFFGWSDGDVGRAAIEMGVIGVGLVLVIALYLLPVAYRSARVLLSEGHEEEDIAMGVGALVLSTGALVLIGSPLSTVPHGIIWWFLLGALIKLAVLKLRRPAEQPS